MSTYFKVWNATIAADEPSGYIPDAADMVGQFCDGQPVLQGLEQGTIVWDAMTLASWIDLWDRWNTNKNTSGTFIIPGRTSGQSWTTWRSVTAYVMGEPEMEYRERNCYRVTMRIVITA